MCLSDPIRRHEAAATDLLIEDGRASADHSLDNSDPILVYFSFTC